MCVCVCVCVRDLPGTIGSYSSLLTHQPINHLPILPSHPQATVQRKALISQEERLEVAQGQAETSLVQANMLLHMPDYAHLQQTETIIGGIRSQLVEEDLPLYQGPVSQGDIPVHINPKFPDEINNLGVIGGGTYTVRNSL